MTAWKAFLMCFGIAPLVGGHGFVLYGVDPPGCSVGGLWRLHFVSVSLKKKTFGETGVILLLGVVFHRGSQYLRR